MAENQGASADGQLEGADAALALKQSTAKGLLLAVAKQQSGRGGRSGYSS